MRKMSFFIALFLLAGVAHAWFDPSAPDRKTPLSVRLGGTGITEIKSGRIPYGNLVATSSLTTSANLLYRQSDGMLSSGRFRSNYTAHRDFSQYDANLNLRPKNATAYGQLNSTAILFETTRWTGSASAKEFYQLWAYRESDSQNGLSFFLLDMNQGTGVQPGFKYSSVDKSFSLGGALVFGSRNGVTSLTTLATLFSPESGKIKTNQAFIADSVAIGTDTINQSAKMQIDSTTKGVLFPRMSTAQRENIPSPAEGLIVYDLTEHKLFVFTGSDWEAIAYQ